MSIRQHTLIAVPLALATLAAVPSVAPAADVERFISYSADVSATVKHGLTQHRVSETSSYDREIDSSSRLDSHVDQITFRKDSDGSIHLLHNGSGDAIAKTGGTIKATSSDHVNGTRTATCAPSGSDDWGNTNITSDRVVPGPLTGDEALIVQLGTSPAISWRCNGTGVEAQPQFSYFDGAEDGTGSHDFSFDMPKEAVGAGKFIQLMKGPPAGNTFCPGRWEGNVTQCGFSWKGTLTMVKTGETVVAPPEPAAQNPAPASPAPTTTPAPAGPQKPSSSGAGGRPKADEPKVDRKSGDVTFRASCPTGCAGSATISVSQASRGKASAAAARKPLATLRFRVRAGKASTVRLRVSKKARRAMRKAGRARVTVALAPTRGTALKRTFSVKVR